MNREKTKSAILVMQAYVDGDSLESRIRSHPYTMGWALDSIPSWNWSDRDYCIKRSKPREWWACWNGDNPKPGDTRHFPFPEYSEDTVDNWDNYIKVREVL